AMRWMDVTGTTLDTAQGDIVTPVSGSYSLVEVTGEAPAGTAYVNAEARVLNDGDSGVRIDDAEMIRVVGDLGLLDTLPINLLLGGTFADFIEIATTGKIYSGKSTYAAAAAGWFLGLNSGT